MLEGRLVLP